MCSFFCISFFCCRLIPSHPVAFRPVPCSFLCCAEHLRRTQVCPTCETVLRFLPGPRGTACTRAVAVQGMVMSSALDDVVESLLGTMPPEFVRNFRESSATHLARLQSYGWWTAMEESLIVRHRAPGSPLCASRHTPACCVFRSASRKTRRSPSTALMPKACMTK